MIKLKVDAGEMTFAESEKLTVRQQGEIINALTTDAEFIPLCASASAFPGTAQAFYDACQAWLVKWRADLK